MRRRILYPFALLWCLAYMALGREVKLAWDTPPTEELVTSWRVWQSGQVIATTAVNQATVTLSSDPATLTVTAINSAGESLHSQPLAIPEEGIPPPPPLVRLILEKSTDLTAWEQEWAVPVIELPQATPGQFYRLRIETP